MGICSADDGSTLVQVLLPGSKADTAAASSGWIDCRSYIGTIVFDVSTDTITGTLAGKIQGASDSGGTGAADISGATHTNVTTANQVRSIVVPATAAPYMKYVGTVTTGPVVASVTLRGRKATV
jgi:hypothetical protein